MSQALLQLCNLSVRYLPEHGPSVVALDDVGLSVAAGEIVGILGESGSGKSTLGSAIIRVLPASAEYEGSILFEGRDLLKIGERELCYIRGKCISLVSQDPATALNPVIRVGAQISEVLRAHGELDRRGRNSRVQELLHEVGFDDPERIASSYPQQLSGGQRQRVVIAQAIACNPSLIVADEPTSKLDLPLQLQILGLMSGIVRKYRTALLWITHDPATLLGFADRVAVIQAGRLVEEGPVEETFRQPRHPYTQTLVGLTREFAVPDRSLLHSAHAH